MKNLKNEEGFTLVELMVVVAIIGVLSAVAIPNFKKYQAKAKTSEAKLQLSSVYSAETAFMADSDTYASCLDDMGYDPSNEKLARYYLTGFNAAASGIGIVSNKINGIDCKAAAADGSSFYSAGKKVASKTATIVGALPASSIVEAGGAAFVAGAAGYIDASKVKENAGKELDQWTVNESKFFDHVITGY